jgi:beta-lactamase regulating signal transducer with metallopeptidase domain
MITALMLYALAVGALVALGALVLEHTALAARLPRRFPWLGALVLLAGLTLAAPWRLQPTAPVVAPAAARPVATPVLAPSTVVAALPTHLLETVQSAVTQGIADLAVRVPRTLDRTLGFAWIASTMALLALLSLLLRRLDTQRRRWPRAQLLGTAVRVAETAGPAVYGLLTPDIVIPRALLARDTTEQALVLAHEEEHRRAHDPLLLACATALVALLPWHPVAWWCLARLRVAIELDCDARVLRRGVSARRYGDVLLSLASSLPVAPRLAHVLALFDAPRHLERRLLAMTSPVTRRAPVAVAGLALIGSVFVIAACNTDVPTAAEVRDADVATVTRTLALPSGSNAVTYFVDGVRRSEAEAQGVRATDIASIEVMRGNGANAANEVRITTRAADGAAAGRATGGIVEERVVTGVRRPLLRGATDSMGVMRVGDSIFVRRDSAASGRGASRVTLSGDSVFMQVDSLGTRYGAAGDARVRVRLMANGTAGDSVIETAARMPYIAASPGDSAATVIVRGSRSEPGTPQPLIIIDGIIATVPNALQHIKPDQIETIEVIKGPAAQRVYGERGANGVIKVTLKN